MTKRTHNLIGAVFCAATAALLIIMSMTGIGQPPMDSPSLTQSPAYEALDHQG